MGKFWALLFLSVPIWGVVCFVVAPYYGIWLPKDVSEDGRTIDSLFYFILYLTGAVFIVTEVAMFWFMWRYDGKTNADTTKFTHGSHSLEVVWTILPAATLLFIAIYQMSAWADTKMKNPSAEGVKPLCEVIARQWDWRLKYPGADGELGTEDDVNLVGEMHVPVGEKVLFHLKSMDVLHSFFVPALRVKQDAVPGSSIPVWFKATQEDPGLDIVCAELCGGGHYRMKGRMVVESREKFDAWMKRQIAEQSAEQDTSAPAPTDVAKESS